VPQHHPVIEVELPSGDTVSVVRRRFSGGPGPRVAVVAGIRGDAPEGVRVAHELITFLSGVEDRLAGTVDVYPCANPLAAHRGLPRWPFFDSDLNRLFPGDDDGHPPERVAAALNRDVQGADQVVEVRGARAAFSEVTQAHVRPGRLETILIYDDNRTDVAGQLAAKVTSRFTRTAPAAAGGG
jgi:hypothetical protein